jgi:hypothetical protein
VPCASRPRRVLPTGHPWPVGKIVGIHASTGAKHAPAHTPWAVMLGAARRGGGSTAQSRIKSPGSAFFFSPPSPCGRGLGEGVAAERAARSPGFPPARQ